MTKANSKYKSVVSFEERIQSHRSKWLCKFHAHFGYLNPRYAEEVCKPRGCHHLIDLEEISEERRRVFFELIPSGGVDYDGC